MTPEATVHITETGHLPEVRAVSWGCTCGEAGVRTYTYFAPAQAALRLVQADAARHALEVLP